MDKNHVEKQVRDLVEAFIAEMATHNVPMTFLGSREMPVMSSSRLHLELTFEGRCDKATYDALEKLDEENIAGLGLAKPTLRHNAQGIFDPTLGFRWLLTTVVNKWPDEETGSNV